MWRKITVLLFLLLLPSVGIGADRVAPQSDLTYIGTFKAPSGVRNGSDWTYRYFAGLGYRPGDISNPDGYLVGGGHYDNPLLAEEIAIPALVTNHNYDFNSINSATVTRAFADITGGRQVSQGDGGIKLSDVLYLPQQTGQSSAKYYWAMSYYYDTVGVVGGSRFGWVDLDFTNAIGKWGLDIETRMYDKYLLEINSTWAAAQPTVGNRILGIGRVRHNGSFGPSLYTIAPWLDGSPPSDGQQLSYTKLIEYPDDQHTAEFYSYGVQSGIGSDAAWVTINGKQAFVVLTEIALSSDESDRFYRSSHPNTTGAYKNYCLNGLQTTLAVSVDADDTTIVLTNASAFPSHGTLWVYPTLEHISYTGKSGNTLTGCTRGAEGTTAASHTAVTTGVNFRHEVAYETQPEGSGGPQNFPVTIALAFYDVNQIAEIAAGTRQAWDIQPYTYFSLEPYFWASYIKPGITFRNGMAGGLAYDAANNKLYVGEINVTHGGVSVFHVFSLDDIGSALDSTPPPPVSGISVDSGGVVTWTASSELAPIYVVEKYYENICGVANEYRPIAGTTTTTWTDPFYTPGDSYQVQVYDAALNQSNRTQPHRIFRNVRVSEVEP